MAGGALATETAGRPRGGWQPGPMEYHPSRVIVRFADTITTSAATDSITRLGYSLRRTADFEPSAIFPGGLRIGIVELPDGARVDDAIIKLDAAPGILYAERDSKHYTDTPVFPNDTHFNRTWGLHNQNCQDKDPEMSGNPVDDADIDAPEAWAIGTGSSELIVAVIDTGIYVDHPDLNANIWRNPGEIPGNGIDDDGNGYIDDVYGWDFFNDDNTVYDPNQRDRYGDLNDDHGTHCAGTIGAVGNNNMGVPGINWNVKIISLKFIGPDGGYASDAILAMQYAHAKGAKVISCSWGGGPYEQSLKDAIEATNALVICAAGNSGQNTDVNPHYPSSYTSENIISVAASMQNDQPCNYPGWWSTCYGLTSVDLFAPGGYIASTILPDPVPPTPAEAYAYFWGTSMATPHVSGVSALLASTHPTIPLYQGAPGWSAGMPTVKDAILTNVDVKPAFQGKVATGGRMNAAAAIASIGGPVITSVEATPTYGPPPLTVAFSATALSTGAEITDKWWSFGDESEPVHEWNTTHVYSEEGLFTASFHVVDADEEERTATIEINVLFPSVISVTPSALRADLVWEDVEEQTLNITNSGLGELTWVADVALEGMIQPTSGRASNPLGSGGPDSFGYVWVDSDTEGVGLPEWIEISQTGTRLTLGDDNGIEVNLPFEFPFYGEIKTKVNVCSNGYLTFGPKTNTYRNTGIPDTAEPNDLIAVFWDDLQPNRDPARVYYYGDDNVFVVQYQDVKPYAGAAAYTFQVVLTPAGTITYHYKTMPGAFLDEATIGIENKTGTVGLQVAYNEDYVHDDLAVMFMPTYVAIDKTSGVVAPGASDTITATFKAGRLAEGDWAASIRIACNDPVNPEVTVPAVMHVESRVGPRIESIAAAPWAGKAPLEVHFSASARDIDGEIVSTEWNFGDGSAPVTGTLTPVHTYVADGEYTATLTVTDDDGLTATASVQVIVANLPKAEFDPASFNRVIRAHRTQSATLTLTNVGDATLTYTATIPPPGVIPEGAGTDIATLGAGGPDQFGYMWTDSDEPGGPAFNWAEIQTVGTKLSLSNDGGVLVNLPFEFPFYGQQKQSIRICSDGYLTFGTKANAWQNKSIPNTADPNDLLAVYWDDLNPNTDWYKAGVYHYYDAANNRFIIEWYEVERSYSGGTYTFQAILYPDGTIVYQYKEMDLPMSYVSRGTIGIENSTGTDGLQVLYNKRDYVHGNLAIRIKPFSWLNVTPSQGNIEPGQSLELGLMFDLTPTSSGPVDGAIVFETNDIRKPMTVIPIHIEVIPNQAPVITAAAVSPPEGPKTAVFQFAAAAHDPDGQIADKHWTFGDNTAAVHEFAPTHTYAANGKYTATFTAIDNDGYETSASVVVNVTDPASASWNPAEFNFRLAGGQTASGTLMLANAGPGVLVFGSDELPSAVARPERSGSADPNAKTIAGLYDGPALSPERSPWLPEDVGSVVTSWTCPVSIDPWGVAVLYGSGNLVIGDGAVDPTVDYVITPEGTYTGTSWSADFGGYWSADMAFDGTYIWQVNVGGDNAIHKIDPANGQIAGSIRNLAWATVSQRGLAYNSNDDTFYIGGWNEDVIYKIKGESWDSRGEVIEHWSMADAYIAGLAYHPAANVIAVASSDPAVIYLVDASSHATVGQFPIPGGGMGAGCEFDSDGNLWVAAYDTGKMYLLETGLGSMGSDSWLSWDPTGGTVAAGGNVGITVTVDTDKLNPGVHTGTVVLFTNDVNNPMIMVPVTAQVVAPPVITEATASPTLGEPGMEVTFHAAYIAPETPVTSHVWDFGDGQSSTELDVTHVYAQPGTYTATFTVVDEMGATAQASFEIEVKWMPRATVEPTRIEVTLAPKATHTETVSIGNTSGNADLEFSIKLREGNAPTIAMPKRIGLVSDPSARTARGLYSSIDSDVVKKIAAFVRPDAMGSVILSWQTPAQIDLPWGLGYNGNVWISDPVVNKDHVVTAEGVHTGSIFDTPWAGSWPADMAYDPNHDLMWQVNVGGDNGIYGLDPATGAVVASITSGGQWTYEAQRGLAYDAATDTFYIGGWNEDIIYHINGLSHSSPGSIIAAYTFSVGIAGLALHPNGILFVANNGEPDMIFALDLETLAVVAQFPHPYGGDYNGAGLALSADGNLWAASMDNTRVYLIDTEMPLSTGGIAIDPTSGNVAKGTSQGVSITIDAAKLGQPGEDVQKYLEITTNDPFKPALFVDVIVHIEGGPTIVSATATPNVGHPPLTVAFDATVEPGAKPISDTWWEFGDGSDPVHELQVEHVYAELGEYEAVLHVIDENEVETTAKVKVTVKWLPTLDTYPSSFDETIQVGEQEQTALTVSNTGVAPMNFGVSVAPSFAESPEWKRYAQSAPAKGDYEAEPRGYAGAGAGGPDLFGYVWMDSNEPHGPEFDWIEISDVGSAVTMSDETIVSVPLPFAFPFYGAVHNQVRVCSNGYLTFGTGRSEWINAPIPNPSDPNSLIAPFWDDLMPGTAGRVYYYYDEANNQFIVEYKNMSQWGSTADLTFEVILRPNGTIVYQYKTMIGDLASATVGIENDTGTDGLQVVYNAPYIEDGMAIAFAPVGKILTVSPTSGYLLPGNHQDVVVTLGDTSEAAGEFSLYIYVSANDPFRPFAAIPVHLVINLPPAVTITAPAAGAELHGVTEVKWTAADADNAADELAIDLYWTRDGETWNTLGEGMANTGVFAWNTIEVGAGGETFRLRARVTDPTGASSEFTTGEFTIVNLAPSAAFSFTPSPATRRDVVKFTDESTDDGTIVAWLWGFGDGATSDQQNPEHKYSAKGEFTVSLTVTDNGGLTATAEKTIVVGNAAPVAAFSFAPESPNAGVDVAFTNESTDDAEIVACFWEFGDGTTSVEPNPTHAYATSGIFTVRLTVIDDDHVADSMTRNVEVVNAPPVAAFSFTPSPATVLDDVKFTDESTDDGEIVAWRWEFGDGAESDEQNPEHKYAAKGKFTVKLTVTDNGDLSDSVEHEITIKNLPPEVRLLKPTAGVVWTGEQTIEWEATDPDDEASALKITLEYALQADGSEWKSIATSQDNTGKHKWDTSQVARGGRYKVRATAVDPDGGTATATSGEFIIVVLTRAIVAAPNPAHDSVTFYYDIPADGTLHVYDIAGRLIYSALLPASMHAYEWNLHAGSRPLANGVYLYIVVSDAQKSEVGRLVVNR